MGNKERIIGVLNTVNDSGLSRVGKWIKEKDIAMLTAFRDKLVDCVHGDTGEKVEKKTNLEKNRELKAALLKLGYGVTKVDGSYVEGFGEESSKEVKENSFLVVNLKDDPKFEQRIRKLGEYYCQDSVFVKKHDETAYLIGTNYADFPGYNKRTKLGAFKPGKEATFMSRIKGRPYNFDELLYSALIDKTVDLDCWETSQVNTKFLITKYAAGPIAYLLK